MKRFEPRPIVEPTPGVHAERAGRPTRGVQMSPEPTPRRCARCAARPAVIYVPAAPTRRVDARRVDVPLSAPLVDSDTVEGVCVGCWEASGGAGPIGTAVAAPRRTPRARDDRGEAHA